MAPHALLPILVQLQDVFSVAALGFFSPKILFSFSCSLSPTPLSLSLQLVPGNQSTSLAFRSCHHPLEIFLNTFPRQTQDLFVFKDFTANYEGKTEHQKNNEDGEAVTRSAPHIVFIVLIPWAQF